MKHLEPCKISPCKIKKFTDLPMIKPLSEISFLRHLGLLVVAASYLCVAPHVSGQQVPTGPPPAMPQESPRTVPDKSAVAAPKTGGSAAVSDDYKIGPADVLKIEVWDEPKFSGAFTVNQDGKFVYPLSGEIVAGDLTTAAVKESVTKAVSKYVVKPRVDVTVAEVQSKKYYLNGLVSHPGEYLLSVPTTVLQALSKAGGLQDFANGKKIYVLRGTTKLYFNYKEVSNGKKMEQNILLQPGDQVFVP